MPNAATPTTPPAFPNPSFWTANRVRSTFIDFFKTKPFAADGHRFVASSPAVPVDDPTLLFTNAGMNQFKPVFLGQTKPGDSLHGLKRAVNSQKCIRAGGKHNDLDDVGKDTYHHTFFEMLGNWSFGDYFKAEAITWSFELLTKVYGIPADRLYATYFKGEPSLGLEPDEECRQLWLKFLPESHVLPGNMKDNFWEMGETGPCGPCTEIHFDRIGGRNAAGLVNTGDPDVLEIWNNVFIQFNRVDAKTLNPLPAKHVDTGMGMERLVSVMQGKRSNYDTDVFFPIFAEIERLTKGRHSYRGKLGAADKDHIDTAFRVIADHIRTLTFAITDGATPSNEGRGYVLRRILRRAVRYGRQTLGLESGFFAKLVPTVVEHFGEFFPELKKNPQRVADIIKDEEESFGKTLDRGLKLFDEAAQRAVAARHAGTGGHKDFAVISGEDAFKLHDTYGFPVDLTKLMAEERALKVDEAGYETLMEQAKEKARAGSGGKFSSAGGGGGGTGGGGPMILQPENIAQLEKLNIPRTDDREKFHANRQVRAQVKAIWNGSNFDEHTRLGTSKIGQPVAIILDKTSFYAEMGGQEADHGRLNVTRESRTGHSLHEGTGGEFRVEDVRAFGGYVLHIGHITRGELRVGDDVLTHTDHHRRHAIASNHTATHLINLALRDVLGEGIDQKGSLVAPDRLRFDFSHTKSVAPEELARIEQHVTESIRHDLKVYADSAPLFLAKGVTGLRAVFGEAYPDPVRVVAIGQPVATLLEKPQADWNRYSIEFCGGTHVGSTREIGKFVFAGEEAVAKGIRRVTALTGVPAQAAIAAAEGLAARIAAAKNLTSAAFAAEVGEIVSEMEQMTLPAVRKAELRNALTELQERVKNEQKAASAAKATEAAGLAKQIAQSALLAGSTVVINSIDVGDDRKALQAALNTVAQTCPKSAVMLFAPDAAGGTVAVMAIVPPPLVGKGLSAGDWVREAAAVLGGKGGGRPEAAQGGGTNVAKLKEAVTTATAFAHKKLGL
jgi:alanyl-tRNA synthetase